MRVIRSYGVHASEQDADTCSSCERMGHADEVARAAVYQASDQAGYVSGAELTIDGGLFA